MSARLQKLRGKLAIRLIYAGRHLLGMSGVANGDFDTCVYCRARGCESGEAVHASDCPSETGLYPVSLKDLWPAGPAVCEGCGTELWPGDVYAHIKQEPIGGIPVYQVSCIGCAALEAVR